VCHRYGVSLPACQHGHSGDARCALVFPHDGGARNVISRPKVCLVAVRCYSRHGAEVTSFLGRPHLIVLLLRLRLVGDRVVLLRGRCPRRLSSWLSFWTLLKAPVHGPCTRIIRKLCMDFTRVANPCNHHLAFPGGRFENAAHSSFFSRFHVLERRRKRHTHDSIEAPFRELRKRQTHVGVVVPFWRKTGSGTHIIRSPAGFGHTKKVEVCWKKERVQHLQGLYTSSDH